MEKGETKKMTDLRDREESKEGVTRQKKGREELRDREEGIKGEEG